MSDQEIEAGHDFAKPVYVTLKKGTRLYVIPGFESITLRKDAVVRAIPNAAWDYTYYFNHNGRWLTCIKQ